MAMREKRPEPFGNMHFRVEIDGLHETRAVEVIFPEARIVAGEDRSRTVHHGSLILRRGLTDSREWYDWWDRARRSSRELGRSVAVVLLDPGGRDVQRWTFGDCEPGAYLLSSLDALGNAALIETLELSVGAFEMS